MNINISNLQSLNVFQHKNAAIRFQSVRLSNASDAAEEKHTKDKSRCTASISEEAKNLLGESKEEDKKNEANVKAEDKWLDIDWNNVTMVKVEGINNFRGAYRLERAAYQLETENVGKVSFSSLANEYDEMKKEMESQHSGINLEWALNELDKNYQRTLDYVADDMKGIISYWKWTGRVGALEKGIERVESIIGKSMSEMNTILDELGLDKNKPLEDNIDAIVKYLDQRKDKSAE